MSISSIEASENGLYKPRDSPDIHFTIAACCTLAVCLFGMLGNGIAFWFLCFRIPINTYTVYIINLMIADFVYLFFSAILMIMQVDHLMAIRPSSHGKADAHLVLEIVCDGAYNAGMFFLLAISIERCLSVYYPIWYRCRRPKHLSLIACLIMWLFAFLVSCLENIICSPNFFSVGSVQCTVVQTMTFVLSICISVPLMIFSSTILIIRIQKTSKRCRSPKLYTIIIITVFVFLVATVPVKFTWLLLHLKYLPKGFHTLLFFFTSILCTVLSSAINPYIYFVVGRQKKQKKLKFKGSIQSALHSAFHVDDEEVVKSFEDHTSISYIKT